MTFLDIYKTGNKQRSLGHLANLVKLANINGSISNREQLIIDRVCKNLNVTKEEYNQIKNDPEGFPINPPMGLERRIERLYNLTVLICIQHEPSNEEIEFLKKLTVGLGFPIATTDSIVNSSIEFMLGKNQFDRFKNMIKKVSL